MFVGKNTGKGLGKEESGMKHAQGKGNSPEVSFFPIWEIEHLIS